MTLLRIVAAVVVIAVWAALYGKYLLVAGTPAPPAELSGLMLAVVTWLFAGAAKAAGSPRGESLRRKFGEWLLSDKKEKNHDAD